MRTEAQAPLENLGTSNNNLDEQLKTETRTESPNAIIFKFQTKPKRAIQSGETLSVKPMPFS